MTKRHTDEDKESAAERCSVLRNSRHGSDAEIAPDASEHCPLRLHRPQQVADWFDVSLSTVHRMVAAGDLEAVYVRNALRITDRSFCRIAQAGTRLRKPRGTK